MIQPTDEVVLTSAPARVPGYYGPAGKLRPTSVLAPTNAQGQGAAGPGTDPVGRNNSAIAAKLPLSVSASEKNVIGVTVEPRQIANPADQQSGSPTRPSTPLPSHLPFDPAEGHAMRPE